MSHMHNKFKKLMLKLCGLLTEVEYELTYVRTYVYQNNLSYEDDHAYDLSQIFGRILSILYRHPLK